MKSWATIAALACLALTLTACGGGSSPSAAGATATPSASTSSSSAALSAFRSCLKAHGVSLPAGTRPFASRSPRPRPTGSFPTGSFPAGGRGGFGGTNSAAFKACQKYAPAGFGGGGFRGVTASALAAFKSCMSQHGITVTGTTARQILTSMRTATGKTATAYQTCRVLLQPAPTPSPSA